MKIGVISDTHIPLSGPAIPGVILKEFKSVDLILHAGDLVEVAVLDSLKKLAPVHAVSGNMDNFKVRTLLPEKDIIKVGKFRIGLIHGNGPPQGLVKMVRSEFTEPVDVIVFGHSHRPMNEVKDGILFFNPGSPTDKIFATYNSYGILEADGEIKGTIIRVG